MLATRLRLKNWRNFRELDVPLRDVTFVLGPNASGKSHLLDVFRFLRDIGKQQGGGLQAAMTDRGGMSKIRSLHARRDPELLVDVELANDADGPSVWRYVLGFRSEGKGAQRILISQEEVWRHGERILYRPTKDDEKDVVLLTQTHLEQMQTNAEFRDLVDFFSSITYLHLVPQLLKFSERIGGRIIADDPFGQGFLERLAKTQERTRNARLRKIINALTSAVPQFKDLRFIKDGDTGRPHLQALYAHHRPNSGWQTEEHFSDGTLRLIALLWALQENNSMLLLEEPEISLNDAVVRELPLVIERSRPKKNKGQVILSTHSEALLSNPGIDGRRVLLLETGEQGSTGRPLVESETQALESGLSIAEVVLPKTRPKNISQLSLW